MRTVDTSDRNLQDRRFGRRGSVAIPAPPSIAGDARLFVLTFAGGFLFMTVYLA